MFHERRIYGFLGLIGLLFAYFAPLVLWGEPRVGLLIRNTLALAAGTSLLAVPTGTLIAFLLFRTDLRNRTPFLLAFSSLLFVPLYLQAAGWDAGFGKQGWFSFQQGSVAHPLLDGWRAAIWIHGWAAVPWVILLTGAGLRLVEPEVEEAALLDGSAVDVFWRITWRRMWPSVVVSILWIGVLVGTEITVTDLYRVRTFAEEIYLDVPFVGAIDTFEPQRPTALTTIYLLGGLAAITLWLLIQIVPAQDFPSPRESYTFHLGRFRSWGAAVVGLALLLAIGVPLLNLVYKAGLVVEQVDSVRTRDWSLTKFAEVVGQSPRNFAAEHGWTVLIAGLAASAAVGVAAPLGWLARRGGYRAWPALLVSIVGLAVPGPLIGLTLIWMLNREGHEGLIWLYDRSILAPWVAMLIKSLPITILICWNALRTVPESLLENAHSEGAGPLARFWRIGLASRWRYLAGAWLAAYAVAAGDLAASILVIPPGVSTIAVRVFGLLHAGVDDQVAGICLTTAWIYLVIGAIWARLMKADH